MVRKIILTLCLALTVGTGIAVAQNKVQKPKIMVVPSRQWCAENGYGTRLENGMFAPNLHRALEDPTFRAAVSGVENVFTDMNYPPENLSASLDKMAEENAIGIVQTGKDGSVVQEDDIDVLLRSISPDVSIELEVAQVSRGAFNQVKYNIKVCDAASSKTWMTRADVSKRSSEPVEWLIQDAVQTFAEEMIDKIQRQFDTILSDGRESTIVLRMSDTSPYTFESEVSFQGDHGELSELIEYWLNENAVNSAYTIGTKTPNTMKIEQCRIPTTGKAKFGGKTKALSANDFVGDLRRFLESTLGDATISTIPKGLGTVYCVISNK